MQAVVEHLACGLDSVVDRFASGGDESGGGTLQATTDAAPKRARDLRKAGKDAERTVADMWKLRIGLQL